MLEPMLLCPAQIVQIIPSSYYKTSKVRGEEHMVSPNALAPLEQQTEIDTDNPRAHAACTLRYLWQACNR